MTEIRLRLAAALDSFEEKRKERAKRKESRQVGPSQHDRDLLINTLALIAASAPGEVNQAFRTPSRETTQGELSNIAKRVSELTQRLRDRKCSVRRAREQLAQRLEEMHETTICALSNARAIIIHGEPARLNVGFVRCGLPGLLRDDSTDRDRLANELDSLAQAVATAEAPDTTDEGRWPDRRAQTVANILARFHLDATGLPPTISTKAGGPQEGQHYGPFLELVDQVFKAMNIGREAFSYARRAADKIREKGEEKSTP